MNPSEPPHGQHGEGNGAPNTPNAIGGAANMSVSTPHPLPLPHPQSAGPMPPPAWSSQMSTFPANNAQGGPNFTEYSAATTAILVRLQSQNGPTAGSAAFEAKRAEIMQSYVTSDKLPTPPPIASAVRRGRGGRVGTPSGLHKEVGASPATGGSSGRGSGRGRGRGRGGRGGRGGKRKRNDSEEESEVCISEMP
jgi:hypothetical protein